MIRLLLIPAIWGCVHLLMGEYYYARGMAASGIEASLESLTRAGEVYPAAYVFRTAQAVQLYRLSERLPEVADVAAESLRRAILVDPRSVELVSMLLAVQRTAGRCGEAKFTAERMVRLAPRSDLAKSLSSLPCKGPSNG